MKNKTTQTKDVDCVFEKLGDDVLLLSVEIVYSMFPSIYFTSEN